MQYYPYGGVEEMLIPSSSYNDDFAEHMIFAPQFNCSSVHDDDATVILVRVICL